MEDNYIKAYKEVVEILKYVPDESVNKIPKEMRDMFEKQQLKTYNFKIDITKSFEEQELLEETKAILANIFRDYWATDYQKTKILEKENQDREELENQKRKRFNPDNIFNNDEKNNRIKQDTQVQHNKNLPIEIQKKNIFTKLLNFIKKLLHH